MEGPLFLHSFIGMYPEEHMKLLYRNGVDASSIKVKKPDRGKKC